MTGRENASIDRLGKPQVAVVADYRHQWKPVPEQLHRIITAGVIHHDDLPGGIYEYQGLHQRRQVFQQQLTAIERGYNHRD